SCQHPSSVLDPASPGSSPLPLHDALPISVLWPMYPADDLEGAVQRLTMFLEQYWGGPSTYSEQRGHPRLRMRHAAYKVGPKARADRQSTRLNSSHVKSSYAVFCLKKTQRE